MCIHQLEEKVPVVAPRIMAGDGVVGELAGVIRLRGQVESAHPDMARSHTHHNSGGLYVAALDGPAGGDDR